MNELDKIILAQKSRGSEISSGGLINRIKAFIPLLIPLFISAFQRAEDLAIAMEVCAKIILSNSFINVGINLSAMDIIILN
jgi:hypothetical protein